MAKNDAAFDKFLADVLAEVPEDRRVTVEESLKASKILKEGVLARDDYSRNMDRLRTDQETLNAQIAEAKTRIAGWETWYADMSTQFTTKEEALKAYEKEYGPLETKGTRKPVAQATDTVTKDVLAAELNKAVTAAMQFSSALSDVKLRHYQEFKEMLPESQLLELAAKENIPLSVAHDRIVADKRKTVSDAVLAERIKTEREQAVAEFQQQHKFPIITTSNQPHPLDLARTNAEVNKSEGGRVGAAVADFMKSYTGGPIA